MFHHEDCVYLSWDRLCFRLKRRVDYRLSRRCCCIQLSSPTDQLAPSLKLENPLWEMFEYGTNLNFHRVLITDTAILSQLTDETGKRVRRKQVHLDTKRPPDGHRMNEVPCA